MKTGTVWGVALYIVGIVATIAATQVLLGALFPARMAATRHALRERPAVSTLVGLAALAVVILVLLIAGTVLPKIGLEIVVAVLIAAASLVVLFGLGAVASEVGDRLPSSAQAATGWRAMIRGSVVLSLASLLPLAGWFVVFPLSWAAGLGAGILALFGVGAATEVARSTSGGDVHLAVPAPRAAEPAEVSA